MVELMYTKVAAGSLLVILLLVNWSIYKKESHLTNGMIAYLELAPVDPRSLMQGDYMALRFSMANKVRQALQANTTEQQHNIAPSDGFVIAQLDKRDIASFKALYQNQTLGKNDVLLRYRIRNGIVKFATNAFFFQEGHAALYEPARFGQFRINKNGELLLTNMYDKNLNLLAPDIKKQQSSTIKH